MVKMKSDFCNFCNQEIEVKGHIQVCKSCGGPDHVIGLQHVCDRCGRVLMPVYRTMKIESPIKPVRRAHG